MGTILHKQIGSVMVAIVVALASLGAGCTERQPTSQAQPSEPLVPANVDASRPRDVSQRTSTTAETSTQSTAVESVQWTVYRSAVLGIAVPYPEGWNVVEQEGENAMTLLVDPFPIPERSDYPIRITVTVTGYSPLDEVVKWHGDDARAIPMIIGTRSVVRVESTSELGALSDVRKRDATYHWNVDRSLYSVSGNSDDPVLERIAHELVNAGR